VGSFANLDSIFYFCYRFGDYSSVHLEEAMIDSFDFDDFTDKKDESSLAVLREKAIELAAINDHITELEEELEAFNKRKNQLSCVDMPNLMRDLGMNDFTLDSGEKFKLEDFCSGSLNKAPDFNFAKSWVIENGGGDLIKTTVAVDFGTGEHNMAMNLRGQLADEGYDVDVNEGIHPQTYASFGREKLKEWKAALEKGLDAPEPPFRELGLYAGTRVKIAGGRK